jgi:hypothetical protein
MPRFVYGEPDPAVSSRRAYWPRERSADQGQIVGMLPDKPALSQASAAALFADCELRSGYVADTGGAGA